MKFVSLGAAALLALSNVTGATELRLSHQWSNKNFSPKVTEIVAKEVAAANVDLYIKISVQTTRAIQAAQPRPA